MSQRNLLQRSDWMQPSLGFNVGGSGLLSRCEIPNRNGFFVDLDGSTPSPVISVNAHEAGACPRLVPIMVVLLASDNTQVFQPVVIADAVDMVNLSVRPFAVNVQPNQAMRGKSFAVDLPAQIAKSAMRAKARTGFNVCGTASLPLQFARLGVVIKKFFNVILRQARLFGSHLFAPIQQLIGKKPEAVTSGLGLRYFTLRAA